MLEKSWYQWGLRAGWKAGCSPLRTVWDGQSDGLGEDESGVADLVPAAFGDDDILASKELDELTLCAGFLVEVCVFLQQLNQSFGTGDLEALIIEDAKVADQAVVRHLVCPSEEVERVGLG